MLIVLQYPLDVSAYCIMLLAHPVLAFPRYDAGKDDRIHVWKDALDLFATLNP